MEIEYYKLTALVPRKSKLPKFVSNFLKKLFGEITDEIEIARVYPDGNSIQGFSNQPYALIAGETKPVILTSFQAKQARELAAFGEWEFIQAQPIEGVQDFAAFYHGSVMPKITPSLAKHHSAVWLNMQVHGPYPFDREIPVKHPPKFGASPAILLPTAA